MDRPQGNVLMHMSSCHCRLVEQSARIVMKNLKDLYIRRLLEAEFIARTEDTISEGLVSATKFEREVLYNVVKFDDILSQVLK